MSRHDTEHDFEDEGVFNFLDFCLRHDKEHDFDDEDMFNFLVC